MTRPRIPSTLAPTLGRVALFAVLWLVLTEGDPRGLPLAVLAVLVAAAVSLRLLPVGTVRWRRTGVWGMIVFFVRESIHGGIDVARRALDPRLPIDPGFVDHRIRLPQGASRVLFVCSVSLLPGTLSTRLSDDTLRIHVLHRALRAERTIRGLEEHIGEALGTPLGGGPEGDPPFH
jgi:multicomponent Na+:H+ antiporter subunit E